jgi:transcription antitermination factor NusG
VHKAVKHAGVPSFFPQHMRLFVEHGKTVQINRPLFPLYTFAQFDPHDKADPWPVILRIPGVSTILGMKRASRELTEDQLRSIDLQKPSPIRSDVIEKLQVLVETYGGAIPLQKKSAEKLLKNTRVKILDGAFEGFEGLIDEDHVTRVRVLLDIFGRSTPISIPREAIAIAR